MKKYLNTYIFIKVKDKTCFMIIIHYKKYDYFIFYDSYTF